MTIHLSFPGGSVAKNQLANQKTQVQSLSREDPLEEEMASHSSVLAGQCHGQRSLKGYSLWGRKRAVTTLQLNNVYLGKDDLDFSKLKEGPEFYPNN